MTWVDGHRWWPFTLVSLLALALRSSTLVVGFVALVALAVVAWTRAWRLVPAVLIAAVSAGDLAAFLKPVFGRHRPPSPLVELGVYSFPSTHAATTAAFVIAGLLSLPWTSRLARAVGALVGGVFLFVVGALMVYLGGHWVSDVLAGWVLGAVIGYGAVVVGYRIGLIPHSPGGLVRSRRGMPPAEATQGASPPHRGERHLVE